MRAPREENIDTAIERSKRGLFRWGLFSLAFTAVWQLGVQTRHEYGLLQAIADVSAFVLWVTMWLRVSLALLLIDMAHMIETIDRADKLHLLLRLQEVPFQAHLMCRITLREPWKLYGREIAALMREKR